VHGVGPLDGVAQSRVHVQRVVDADAPENQHPILFLDFTYDLSSQVISLEFDLARCQRAGKCAE
jgi:hypothetical protein